MRVEKISIQDKKIIKSVTQLHLDAFSGFFLTFMGKGFLKQMYLSYIRHNDSGLLCAFDENDFLCGFLAYSYDVSGLYKYMIKKRLPFFAWYSFLAFVRKPTVFLRLVRAFLKPGETKREEKYVELTSIAVSPNASSKGIGTNLIDELKNIVDFSKYEYINLETDAENNDSVNKFYIKNGFSLRRTFITHEGRKMNEYMYKN